MGMIEKMKFIADMHTHTIASDHAYSTVMENVAFAKKNGLKYLAITDHGVKMPDSPHIWHFTNMKAIPREIDGVKVVKGIEANIIDYDGNIDVENNNFYECIEWIVASYHHPVCMPSSKAEHTNSYIKLLDNPRVNAIGHCVTIDFDFDFDEVFSYCTKKDKLIELNNSRLNRTAEAERYKEILLSCKNHGTKIIVNSDAHFCTRIGEFEKSIKLLNEVDFPEDLIINADLIRFENYLQKHIKL